MPRKAPRKQSSPFAPDQKPWLPAIRDKPRRLVIHNKVTGEVVRVVGLSFNTALNTLGWQEADVMATDFGAYSKVIAISRLSPPRDLPEPKLED